METILETTIDNGIFKIIVKESNDKVGMIIDIYDSDNDAFLDSYTLWNDDINKY